MVKAVDHIEIVVNDLEETAGFFELLGLTKVRETDHHERSIEYKPAHGDRPVIELHEALEEEQPGINHIAFLVEDLEGTTETLREEGVDHLTGPSGPAPTTGRTSTNLRDPDGRRIQLVKDTGDADG